MAGVDPADTTCRSSNPPNFIAPIESSFRDIAATIFRYALLYAAIRSDEASVWDNLFGPKIGAFCTTIQKANLGAVGIAEGSCCGGRADGAHMRQKPYDTSDDFMKAA